MDSSDDEDGAINLIRLAALEQERDREQAAARRSGTGTGTAAATVAGTGVTSAANDSIYARYNERQLHRMARRAEEETELNRAILLSLQFAENSAGESGAGTGTGAGAGSAGGEREESIQTLMAMGFPREQCEQALRQSHNNVELAANQLLGL
jgi:hypothetical protein